MKNSTSFKKVIECLHTDPNHFFVEHGNGAIFNFNLTHVVEFLGNEMPETGMLAKVISYRERPVEVSKLTWPIQVFSYLLTEVVEPSESQLGVLYGHPTNLEKFKDSKQFRNAYPHWLKPSGHFLDKPFHTYNTHALK